MSAPDFPASFLDALDRAVLERAGKRKGGEVRFRCPADGHEDKDPSARWNRNKSTWCCDSCPAGGGALDLADRFGIPRPEQFAQNGRGQTRLKSGPLKSPRHRICTKTTRFDIRDAAGTLIAVHVRNDYDYGGKDFWWERPDGNRGLGSIKAADLPLYGVHELDGATEVVVVEGEKAADALVGLGCAAVGTVCGAAVTPGDAALAPLLPCGCLALWPDNDNAGRRLMAKIAERLIALGYPRDRIRVITWPEAPDKGDAADLVAGGAKPDDLRSLLDGAQDCGQLLDATPIDDVLAERKLTFTTAREIGALMPEEPDTIVGYYFIAGCLTELDGKAKAAGKTTWMLSAVKAVLTGVDFMGLPTQQ
jgi:hypothetical protein